MESQMEFLIAGDKCVQIRLGNIISPEINTRVRKYFLGIKSIGIKGIIECVPTYSSLSVYYDPLIVSYNDLLVQLKFVGKHLRDINIPQPYVVEIPTCYDTEFGIDLNYLSQYLNLSIEEIVRIHSGGEYLIYMLGFAPGFCFLGEISDRITAPRLVKPRIVVPAGSVGIVGNQTGIYSIESPGGWQLIGRTPVDLYNPFRKRTPIFLKSGDYIRFVPVTRVEFDLIQNDIMQNKYTIRKYLKRA